MKQIYIIVVVLFIFSCIDNKYTGSKNSFIYNHYLYDQNLNFEGTIDSIIYFGKGSYGIMIIDLKKSNTKYFNDTNITEHTGYIGVIDKKKGKAYMNTDVVEFSKTNYWNYDLNKREYVWDIGGYVMHRKDKWIYKGDTTYHTMGTSGYECFRNIRDSFFINLGYKK